MMKSLTVDRRDRLLPFFLSDMEWFVTNAEPDDFFFRFLQLSDASSGNTSQRRSGGWPSFPQWPHLRCAVWQISRTDTRAEVSRCILDVCERMFRLLLSWRRRLFTNARNNASFSLPSAPNGLLRLLKRPLALLYGHGHLFIANFYTLGF